jgi:hypothetical protein
MFFSRFEYHVFYDLYPFVTYLPTLPRTKTLSWHEEEMKAFRFFSTLLCDVICLRSSIQKYVGLKVAGTTIFPCLFLLIWSLRERKACSVSWSYNSPVFLVRKRQILGPLPERSKQQEWPHPLSMRVTCDNVPKFGSHRCLCTGLARSGFLIFTALVKNRLSNICFAD